MWLPLTCSRVTTLPQGAVTLLWGYQTDVGGWSFRPTSQKLKITKDNSKIEDVTRYPT